ncbi:hypothetical protein R4Q14_00130 [Brachyspira intermedia]|uniref:hypothetical protein n=1 Tax=Brachyspira intermedia TaxID=84377 RepID=UPI003005A877
MNKKLLSILFTLFLVGILSISCSNKDKTGSDSSSNLDASYAGDWYSINDNSKVMVIDANGNISFPDLEGSPATKKVEVSGNSCTVTYSDPAGGNSIEFIVTFNNTSSCSIIGKKNGQVGYTDDLVKQ